MEKARERKQGHSQSSGPFNGILMHIYSYRRITDEARKEITSCMAERGRNIFLTLNPVPSYP